MKSIIKGTFGLLMGALADPLVAANFDMAILGGRVMDPETQLDAVLNIGIRDGMIVELTDADIDADQIIDAAGLVVAPGFIDTHWHAMDGFGGKVGARDGVTSALSLEGGAWNIDAWYQNKAGGYPINYGVSVSHERAREIVHDDMHFDVPVDSLTIFTDRERAGSDGVYGWRETLSDIGALNAILTAIDQQLVQGALGIAVTTGYAREGISSYELYALQKLAASYGRVFAGHHRFHGNTRNPQAALGFDEVFANAMALDSPLLVSHNNDFGWWEIEEKLQLARAHGHNMWSEYYPYTAASTQVGSSFLAPAAIAHLGYTLGKDLTIYVPETDSWLDETALLTIREQSPETTVVIKTTAREAWLPAWLRMPHMTVASDAMWMGEGQGADLPYESFQGHPRTAGSHGEALALARKFNVPLMFTLSQLSYWPAKHLGDTGLKAMQLRGRVQVGKVADLVIFDAGTVSANADYATGQQGLPTTGIPYVLVSGTPIVWQSVFQNDVFPGQPIRFPSRENGSFTPINDATWLQDHALDAGALGNSGTISIFD